MAKDTPPAVNWNDAQAFLRRVQQSAKKHGRDVATADLRVFTVAWFNYGAGKGKDVRRVCGNAEEDEGLTLAEAQAKIAAGKFNALGVKGGVEIAPNLFIVILDCDYPSVKPYLEKKYSSTFGETFSQLGSKPEAGHLFFLTNTLPKNSSPTAKKGGEAIGIQSLGRHVFAFCRHRDGKSVYQIERDAEIAFITDAALDVALTSSVEEFGFNWSSKQADAKNAQDKESPDAKPSSGAIEKFLKHREHDKTLNEVLGGTYTEDRSKSDLVLAQKAAYYNLTEAEAELVLLQHGSTKCKERSDDNYIPGTVGAAYDIQQKRFVDISNPRVQEAIREVKRLNSLTPLRGAFSGI